VAARFAPTSAAGSALSPPRREIASALRTATSEEVTVSFLSKAIWSSKLLIIANCA
jgi:hypothetical protein